MNDSDPVRIILDTDIASDVDDVGAVAVLHALVDRGEADVLAMAVSSTCEWSAPCLQALNAWFGRPEIPVGVLRVELGEAKDALHRDSKYARAISEEFPCPATTPTDATKLYRRVLAAQPDRSVVIVSIGFLTNLADLLVSPPDATSDLNGLELVRRKVKHWVCMGGAFPEGREFNLHIDAASSIAAIRDWPTPITFTGFEIGAAIRTGARLVEEASPNNPVRRAYALYFDGRRENRESWDQTAVLYAVRGLDGGLAEMWDVGARGHVAIRKDGSNVWAPEPNRPHAYLIEKMPPERVAACIDELMLHGGAGA